MAKMPISKLTIRGLRSIRELVDFELHNLNVLIGANGSGKSNLVLFLRMVSAMRAGGFQAFVRRYGGADALLFRDDRRADSIRGDLKFGNDSYRFELRATADLGLYFASESGDRELPLEGSSGTKFVDLGRGHLESQLSQHARLPGDPGDRSVAQDVLESIQSWVVYHFHETGFGSRLRESSLQLDHERLEEEGRNLAAVVNHWREARPDTYSALRDAVRSIAPFFDDFRPVTETSANGERVALLWTQRGATEPFAVSQLSDGTQRFIALAAALLQPNMPATVIIDEPELGLHPQAIAYLGGLIRSASTRTQLIMCTQSPLLVDSFAPEDIVVVAREHGESKFRRLTREELSEWIGDYSVGELWKRNVIDGGPRREGP